jgi:hypothetical protein
MRNALTAVLLGLSACVGASPRQPYLSSTVGDRAAIDLTEVVVSVRSDKGQQNLHVWFSALINPTERINPHELEEVEGVLRRAEGRIAAQATADLAGRASVPLASLGKLREELASAGQRTLETAVGRWRLRDRFRIEVAVTSIYFTDGSVGRRRAAERWW